MPNPKGNVETLHHFEGKWKSGVTKTVRVPISLIPQILEYAHKLDNGESLVTSDSGNGNEGEKIDSETLSQVIQMLNEALALKANAGGAIKGKIREALALLQ